MDTFERVKQIVAGILSVNEETVTPDADLANDLGADSLALVEISMAVEEQFGIHLDDEEAFALKTAGQIAECIEARAGTRAVAGTAR